MVTMNEFEQAITEEIRHASRPFSIVREESPSSSREFLTVTLEGADTAAQQENLRQALKETFAMIEASAATTVLGHSCERGALTRLASHVPALRTDLATGDGIDV